MAESKQAFTNIHKMQGKDSLRLFRRQWGFLFVTSILVIYFYIFMEWLFFATKLSFISALNFHKSLLVLIIAPLPPVIITAVALLFFKALSLLANNSAYQRACTTAAKFIPACILASSMLLLVDNFTNTIFDFGIRSTEGLWRYGYGVLYLILSCIAYLLVRRFEKRAVLMTRYNLIVYIGLSLALTSILVGVIRFGASYINRSDDSRAIASLETIPNTSLETLPNILLIASDGLNADHMSVYGYHRDTTPFLRKFVKDALVAENSFSNAEFSGSSTASMMTGKLPTETRLLFPPDILWGKSVYQHLPAIMKKLGYRSIDISIRHFIDAYDLNMRNSYDIANNREFKENQLMEYLASITGQETAYFIETINDRIFSRLYHAFGKQKLNNAYKEATGRKKSPENDRERVNELLSFIDASPAPFFAHLFLMGTHGEFFRPRIRKFSIGNEQDREWMVNYYDDSILDFDEYVKEIINHLKEQGKLDDTIVVIHTDHGFKHSTRDRIPLIIRFPNGEHAGRIRENVQKLDVGPTLLDYLGIKKPDWMRGQSLIHSKLNPRRLILSVIQKYGIIKVQKGPGPFRWWVDQTKVSPPFYSLGTVGIVSCQKWYGLNLTKKELYHGEVRGHTSPCNEDELPTPEEVERLIVNHLSENDYDVSSITLPLPKKYLPQPKSIITTDLTSVKPDRPDTPQRIARNAQGLLDIATFATVDWPGHPGWAYIRATDDSLHIAPHEVGSETATMMRVPVQPGKHRISSKVKLREKSTFPVILTFGLRFVDGSEITFFKKTFQPGEVYALDQPFEVKPGNPSEAKDNGIELIITCTMAEGATNNWYATLHLNDFSLERWE